MKDATRLAFNDAGELEPYEQFDYSALDEAEPGPDEAASMTREEIEAALKTFRALVRWLWANGSKNKNALVSRATFVSWLFLDEVRAHDLPRILAQFDREKPDIGRLVADFKRLFPMVNVPHFKP